MIPAAYLNNWGKETFNNLVVRNDFMKEHYDFVQKFVDVFILLVDGTFGGGRVAALI